jgi:hypothetical protein
VKVTIGKRTPPHPELEGTKLAWIRGKILESMHGHVILEFPTSEHAGFKVAVDPEWNVDPLEVGNQADAICTVLGYVDTLSGSGFGTFGAHVSVGGSEFYVDPKLAQLEPAGGPAPKPVEVPPPPPAPPSQAPQRGRR